MSNADIRNSFCEWLSVAHWPCPFAVTLTLKQCLFLPSEGGRIRIPIGEEAASQNFRHFLNVLNRSLYGKAACRFGRTVAVVPVLEGGRDKRLHYHAVIGCPSPSVADRFPGLISNSWLQTQWGYREMEISAGADRGWLNYMTKLRDKTDFASSIDWMNVHLLS